MLRQLISSAYQYYHFNKGLKCYHYLKLKAQTFSCLKSSKLFMTTSVKSASSAAASGGSKKGFLVYQFPNFNINIARAFSVIGAVACGSAYFTVNDIQLAAEQKEDEVSEATSEKSVSIYGGKFGTVAPYLYGVAGAAIIFGTKMFVNSTLKKILLSTDRETVTFVSYQLFGRDKVLTVPVESVKWKKSKIRIKNYSQKYHIMKSGTVTNRSLLLWSLNSYQGPQQSQNFEK